MQTPQPSTSSVGCPAVTMNGKRSKFNAVDSSERVDKKLNSRLTRLLAVKRKKPQKAGTIAQPTPETQQKGYACLFCKYFSHDDEIKDPSQYVALDCEFVGVGAKGRNSALGRCSVVDWEGDILCDVYAKPAEPITDFRTPWSGIRPRHMKNAMPLCAALDIIESKIEGKTVIGHAVHNDFHVLGIPHPKHKTIDTVRCGILKKKADFDGRGPVSLKRLSAALLGRRIQSREHSSVEDARATMDLFKVAMGELQPQTSTSNNNNHELTSQAHTKSFMEDKYWPDDI